MKRIFLFILALMITLSLAACGAGQITEREFGKEEKGTKAPEDTITPVTEAASGTEAVPETEAETEEPIVAPEGREEAIYEKWLLSGNYDKLLEGSKMTAKNNKTYAHLEDINGDGVRDLFFTSTNGGGIMTYIITIHEGRVVCAGSMNYDHYRERFELKKDTATGKIVVVSSRYYVQTANFPHSGMEYTVYDFKGATLTPVMTLSKYYVDPAKFNGADEVAKIKSETELYTFDGTQYHWWKIDGKYISVNEYNTNNSRYWSYNTDQTLGDYSDVLALKKKAQKQ